MFSDFINQAFSIFPSKARICDGLTVNMVRADILASFYDVAFDHDTFDQLFQFRIVIAAVKNFTYNTDLFFIFFSGIRVVYINNYGWIQEIPFGIKLSKAGEILIVIIGNCLSL